MKKLLVLLAVLCLLAFAGGAHAVTLDKTWYVNIPYVHVYADGQLYTSLWFPTPVGQYWPFQVSSFGVQPEGRRYITVPATVSGVGPDQSLILPVKVTLAQGQYVDGIAALIETNYDPTKMYLSWWRITPQGVHELLGEQKAKGTYYGTAGLVGDGALDASSYYFKLQVVPEPSSVLSLLAGAGCLLVSRRRR